MIFLGKTKSKWLGKNEEVKIGKKEILTIILIILVFRAYHNYTKDPGIETLNRKAFDLYTAGSYDGAIEVQNKALAASIKAYGPNHPKVAVVWNNLGKSYNAKGDYERAIEFSNKALAVFIETGDEYHIDLAATWNNRAHAYYAMGQYQLALDDLNKALPVYEKFRGIDHPQTNAIREALQKAQIKLKQKPKV